MALKVGKQVDDVVLSLWWSGRTFGCRLEQEWLADVGVEQMFCGGEAGGVFNGVGEAGNVEDNGVRGSFGAKALAGFEAALTEGAREAKNSSDGLNIFLLFVGER